MYTISAKLTFSIPHSTSLKDKRQISKSLIDKSRARFNVSASEVDTQDSHQILTLGISTISGTYTHSKNIIDGAVRFIEKSTDALLISLLID